MMRATKYLVGAALAAGLAVPNAAASAATVVHQGDPITRSGTGCLLPDGTPGVVLMFLPTPPTKLTPIGTAQAAVDGSWTVNGTVSAYFAPANLRIGAACAADARGTGAFPLVVPDADLIILPREDPTTTEPAEPETTTPPPPTTTAGPAPVVAPPRPVTARPRFTG
jgi:hypothetical protein